MLAFSSLDAWIDAVVMTQRPDLEDAVDQLLALDEYADVHKLRFFANVDVWQLFWAVFLAYADVGTANQYRGLLTAHQAHELCADCFVLSDEKEADDDPDAHKSPLLLTPSCVRDCFAHARGSSGHKLKRRPSRDPAKQDGLRFHEVRGGGPSVGPLR